MEKHCVDSGTYSPSFPKFPSVSALACKRVESVCNSSHRTEREHRSVGRRESIGERRSWNRSAACVFALRRLAMVAVHSRLCIRRGRVWQRISVDSDSVAQSEWHRPNRARPLCPLYACFILCVVWCCARLRDGGLFLFLLGKLLFHQLLELLRERQGTAEPNAA
jgi:hypothetical protein